MRMEFSIVTRRNTVFSTTTQRVMIAVGVFFLTMFVPTEPPLEIAGATIIGAASACAQDQECCKPGLDENCNPDPDCEDDSAAGLPPGCDLTALVQACWLCERVEVHLTEQEWFDACAECLAHSMTCMIKWEPPPMPSPLPWEMPEPGSPGGGPPGKTKP